MKNECDARAKRYRKVLGATKQGYLWIADRVLNVSERMNSGWEESKGIVLKLSQLKVAEGRREQ